MSLVSAILLTFEIFFINFPYSLKLFIHCIYYFYIKKKKKRKRYTFTLKFGIVSMFIVAKDKDQRNLTF